MSIPAAPGFGDYLGQTVTVAGTALYDAHYTHDRLGRIATWTETIAGITSERRFGYDDAGRLTTVRDGAGALVEEYAFDPNGNRTLAIARGVRRELGVDIGCDASGGTTGPLTTAATGQDQLCRYGDYTYVFDANGRLREKRHISDVTDVTEYTYAGDGRLLRVALPSGGALIDYVHDAQGRRIGRVVDGVLERGWLYKDGINPVAQLDASGAVEATFVYGTRPHVPDFMVHRDGRVLRYVVDHLGSVRALVDVATGDVVERMDYDTWGVVVATGGTGGAWSTQPFGYAGGMYDAATGLVRFGVRDYDAETGRWTAKEPLGFRAETNWYRYAGGEPISWIDFTGEHPAVAVVVVIGYLWFSTPSPAGDTAPVGGSEKALAMMAVKGAAISSAMIAAGLFAYRVCPQPPAAVRGGGDSVPSASAPVGRRGSPLHNSPAGPRTRNADGAINGRRHAGHALDDMQNRGVPPSAVDDAISHGQASPDPIPGRTRHYSPDNDITVITEGDDVISVMTGSR